MQVSKNDLLDLLSENKRHVNHKENKYSAHGNADNSYELKVTTFIIINCVEIRTLPSFRTFLFNFKNKKLP